VESTASETLTTCKRRNFGVEDNIISDCRWSVSRLLITIMTAAANTTHDEDDYDTFGSPYTGTSD